VGVRGDPEVEIERTGELVTVFVHTARPGVLIGKKGTKVDEFRRSSRSSRASRCA
jgi:small subunit ribosomal protein S3